MSTSLAHENVWIDRPAFEAAEAKYHECKAKTETPSQVSLTPLADELAKARQRIVNFKNSFDVINENMNTEYSEFSKGDLSKQLVELPKLSEKLFTVIANMLEKIDKIDARLNIVESKLEDQIERKASLSCAIDVNKIKTKTTIDENKGDDDDVDLFASDSDEEEMDKLKEQRLAEYHAKKSKKPALIAKSSIVLDVKPWSDETDMKAMEAEVRNIEMDGLLWGASKLVPLAYGINKLQISCVVEDEKVSVDLLQEKIEEIEEHVQSVDIAAFNKI